MPVTPVVPVELVMPVVPVALATRSGIPQRSPISHLPPTMTPSMTHVTDATYFWRHRFQALFAAFRTT